MKLHNCPLCTGEVAFHQHEQDCPSGCHHLVCQKCNASFDLSLLADPHNKCEDLALLRAAIAAHWNQQNSHTREYYNMGWTAAAEWAKRDDLIADMDSPAYIKERNDKLNGY